MDGASRAASAGLAALCAWGWHGPLTRRAVQPELQCVCVCELEVALHLLVAQLGALWILVLLVVFCAGTCCGALSTQTQRPPPTRHGSNMLALYG